MMNIDAIRFKVEKLQKNRFSVDRLTLKEALLARYYIVVLDELSKILASSNDQDLTLKLETFLLENWKHVNGTMLCYTALSNSDITDLLCDVATFVAEQKKLFPIQILMPTVCTDHFQNSEKNLTGMDLKKVLKTHALGREGKYLTPLELLAQLTLQSDLRKMNNVYYDFDSHAPDMVYLNEDELNRLIDHSDAAKAIFDYRKQYDALSTNKDNLLDRLNKLIQFMVFNSSHGGIGTSEIAAKGGMIAVADFFEYYNTLPDEIKEKIPAPIRNEIEVLRSFAAPIPKKDASGNPVYDKKGNPVLERRNAEIGSCLGTRGADLKKVIAGNETTLINLQLSDETQRKLTEALEEKFKQAAEHLQKQLNNDQYDQGSDKLGITKKLMETFNVSFNLHSADDLALFHHLSCDEIKEILTLPNAEETITNAVGSIENLVIFIINTSPEKLKILLEKIAPHLIKTTNDLSETLISLDSEKIQVVCTTLKDQLSNIITTADDFRNVLLNLTPDQCTAVCTALKDQLLRIIKTGNDFKNVLFNLTPDQCTAVYTELKDQLLRIIRTAADFEIVLRNLNENQCIAVCTALKDQLSRVITTADDFKNMILYLSENQRTAVYNALKDQLPNIIKTGNDFRNVFLYLTLDQRTAVCTALEDQLLRIIKTAVDFEIVLHCLSKNQITEVCTELKDQWSSIITTANDFKNVIRYLNENQRTVVCTELEDKLLRIIQTADDFEIVLLCLNENQRTAVYNVLKDQLPHIIKTVTDFKIVTHYLTKNQRITVRSTCKKDALYKITVKELKAIVDSYQTTSRFFSTPGPELTAIKLLLKDKNADDVIHFDTLKTAIQQASKKLGGKETRLNLLKDSSSNTIEDTGGVSNVIREIGRAFLN